MLRHLPKDTTVKIEAMYSTHTGTVDTATNYHDKDGDDWYVEMRTDHNVPMYWKQRLDYGKLTVIDGPNTGYTSEYYPDKEFEHHARKRQGT